MFSYGRSMLSQLQNGYSFLCHRGNIPADDDLKEPLTKPKTHSTTQIFNAAAAKSGK